VPTVTELKEQASKAEQQGNLVEAIDIYQHILRHLESWPDALAEELNLYTRVGDLRVELQQPARAFAAYRQAAEHYARLGAADDVRILCVRMINVVPSSADAYAAYAKRLLANGHLNGALDVLREYADKADLKDVARTLQGLSGRSSGETRALLSELIDNLERDYQGHTRAARRISAELTVVPEAAPQASAEPASKIVETPALKVETALPARPKPAEPESPEAQPTASTPRPSPGALSQKPAVAAVPAAPRGVPQPKGPAPRKSDRPAVKAAPARRSGSGFHWRPVGVGGAIAAGLAVLIVAVVRMSGGDASPAPQAMAAMIDTSPGAVHEGTVVGDTVEATTPAPPQTAPATPPRPQPEPEPEPVAAPVRDTVPVLTNDTASSVAAADSPAVDVDSSLVIARPLVLGDLPVQSVAPSEFRGQSGFRVVHMIDSITQFVVESYPVDSTSARRYPVGSVIVNSIPPDTTVSIVRFDERHLVFASGAVPEDSARVLIELLRIREPTN